MSETVRLQIKIDDNGSFKNVEINAEDLSRVIKEVKDNVDELSDNFVKNAAKLEILQGVTSMIGQIQGVVTDLTSAYTMQSSAETRLAQAMQNTMEASQEEINSIKELCSAQQQLGIIGDEIQLSGAQELATYLQKSQSLKTLIPVMNDMVAQQYGYNASAESAIQIASMLGKVMNGQTEALSRYGYKFDEAQKYILKYGDEEERVAVLADVVEEAVGGMNEKMAQTPEGRLVQWNNNMGDLKEKIGDLVIGTKKYIDTAAGLGRSITGILQLNVAWNQLKNTQIGANVITNLSSISLKMLNASGISAAIGVKATSAAVKVLNTALSIGVIGLVSLLATFLLSLFTSSKKAKDGLEELDDATKAYRDASSEAQGAIAKEIVELEGLMKSHGDTTKKIQELNEKYGEIFGSHSTAAEWYDILINKSKDYCKQLGYEAAAKKVASSLGELYVERDELKPRVYELIEKTKNGGELTRDELKEYMDKQERLDAVEKDIKVLEPKLEFYSKQGAEAQSALQNNLEPIGPQQSVNYNNLSISQLEAEAKAKQDILKSVADANSQEAKRAKEELDNIQKIKTEKEKALGFNTSRGGGGGNTKKDKYDGSTLIEDAKSYKELGNNIKYYENALDEADISNTELIVSLSKSIAETKKQQQAIKEVKDATMLEADKPTAPKSLKEVTSLEQIDKAIEYQRKIRSKANGEQLKGIDTEIERLNDLKTAFEDSTHVELQDEQIKTFKQLQDEISYYSRKLQTADVDERKIIQGKINHLQELQEQWQSVLDELNKPGDISTLNTIEDLEDAITYYTAKQKKASGEEALAIQKTIDAINRKKEAQDRLLKIPQMQRELGELDSLSGKELSIELHLVGLNEIQSKIRSLQAMLDDLENPLDDKQREQINGLIASYKNYEKILKKSDASLVQGWGNIKGITGSIESMTQTLKEDGNAWKKITSVVDGAIQIYQSLSGIIELIKVFTGVTEAQTVAEQIKGDTALETGSKTVSGKAMEIAASESATTQAGIETTANVAKGVSGLMSAHSAIPVVGFAVGAALVAAFLAMMASLPKFAEGGIAFGPTLGIFGEYSGANTNPEVVAPLNKLKNLLGDGGNGGGKVVFVMKGRTLRGVLQKETHYTSRTK